MKPLPYHEKCGMISQLKGKIDLAMTNKALILIGFLLLATACRPTVLSPTPTNPSTAIPASPTVTTIPPTLTPTATLEPTATPTALPTLTPTPLAYGPTNFPANINPLTGLQVANPTILDRRPIAVKINLVPRTTYRPPWGISLADIVWEYYHNDGYSRLHAIFYGQDAELAGAIRSGRLPDSDLVQMYKSVFAYGSADAEVNFILLNSAYSNRLVLEGQRSTCPPSADRPMCRFEPTGMDFLLTSTKALSEHITNQGVENGRQNLDGMSFNAAVPANGSPAQQAYIRYSIDNYSRWDYDTDSGRYLLFQDNSLANGTAETFAPLLDRLNDRQVAVENVVILIAGHQYYQQPPNEIVSIFLGGTGKAYALRDGQIYSVNWNRPSPDSVMYLTFDNGTPYPFKPGVTWFYVIGQSSKINENDTGVWRFEFKFP